MNLSDIQNGLWERKILNPGSLPISLLRHFGTVLYVKYWIFHPINQSNRGGYWKFTLTMTLFRYLYQHKFCKILQLPRQVWMCFLLLLTTY